MAGESSWGEGGEREDRQDGGDPRGRREPGNVSGDVVGAAVPDGGDRGGVWGDAGGGASGGGATRGPGTSGQRGRGGRRRRGAGPRYGRAEGGGVRGVSSGPIRRGSGCLGCGALGGGVGVDRGERWDSSR